MSLIAREIENMCFILQIELKAGPETASPVDTCCEAHSAINTKGCQTCRNTGRQRKQSRHKHCNSAKRVELRHMQSVKVFFGLIDSMTHIEQQPAIYHPVTVCSTH